MEWILFLFIFFRQDLHDQWDLFRLRRDVLFSCMPFYPDHLADLVWYLLNGFYFKRLNLDRIYRIWRIFFRLRRDALRSKAVLSCQSCWSCLMNFEWIRFKKIKFGQDLQDLEDLFRLRREVFFGRRPLYHDYSVNPVRNFLSWFDLSVFSFYLNSRRTKVD